jgi:E3 ubiquitin-protein ligase CCNP1IP1
MGMHMSLVVQSYCRPHWSHTTPHPTMRCNSCWLQLAHTDRVYATQCSHVLCHDCLEKNLSRSSSCPVCSTPLDPNSGFAPIDLVPSVDKIKALCGLNPSFILQVASRAIDFFNFQSDLAHAHDAQELDSAKHFLQHQTQQHALTQKDLNNQLRTLKFQLEAIVAERDAQVRLVQEMQSRLEMVPVQKGHSQLSAPSRQAMVLSSPSSIIRSQEHTSSLQHDPIAHGMIERRTTNTDTTRTRDSSSDSLPTMLHLPWHSTNYAQPNDNPASPSAFSRSSSVERRTRLFAAASSISASKPQTVRPPSTHAVINTVQPIPTSLGPRGMAQSLGNAQGSSANSRFTVGAAPSMLRPETPLLRRLAQKPSQN